VIRPTRPRTGALVTFRCAVWPLLLLTTLGCNERPADVREWRVTDHDHTDNPGSGQVQVDPADAGAPAVPGLEDVTIVAWQQNCTRCHGQLGRGDGPQGPMVKATNLSDPTWQGAVSDAQITASIKNGKGAMPAFPLPDGTIANLVKLVRMMNAARAGGHPSAAPSSSAAPVTSGARDPKVKPVASSPVPASKASAP
jgi:mono/diheme cytochrome c family protein